MASRFAGAACAFACGFLACGPLLAGFFPVSHCADHAIRSATSSMTLDIKPATGTQRGQTNAPGGGLSFRPLILINATFTTAKMINVRRAVRSARPARGTANRTEERRV